MVTRRIILTATAVIAASLLLTVLPINDISFDTPIQHLESYYRGNDDNPQVSWSCKVSTDHSILWFNKSYTVNATFRVEFDTSQIGISQVNLSRFYFGLESDLGFIKLFDDKFLPPLMLQNITDLGDERAIFQSTFTFDFNLTGYESVISPLQKKLETEFAFYASLVPYGAYTRSMEISNYFDTGVQGWSPTSIPVVIDNPMSRAIQTVGIWSLLLIPGIIYSVSRNWAFLDRKIGSDRVQHVLYYTSLSFLFLYTTMVLAITFGQVFSFWFPDMKYWFSLMITFLLGFSLSIIITGFQRPEPLTNKYLDQYSRYAGIASIAKTDCKTREELSDTWFGYEPDDLDPHFARLAHSRYVWGAVFLLCFLTYSGSEFSPYPIITRLIASWLTVISIFMLLKCGDAKRGLEEFYSDMSDAWSSYWNLLHAICLPLSAQLKMISPVERIRNAKSSSSDDFELLRSILEPSRKQLTTSQKESGNFLGAALYCYYKEILKPMVDELDNPELVEVLKDVLEPFSLVKSPWKQKGKIDGFVIRISFVAYGIELGERSTEILKDLAPIVTDSNNKAIDEPVFVARVTRDYNDMQESPKHISFSGTKEILQLRLFWAFLSIAFALPVSMILWNFI